MSRKARRAKRQAAALAPSGWRSPLVTEEVRETDPEGKIVLHHRVVDTLGRMLKAGTITEPMAEAGRKFGHQFILAQLDPLRAPDIARIPGNGREGDPGEISLAAREQAHRAMRVLGGHGGAMGSVAWHVLGCGCSLREWTLRQSWNGRQLRPEQATGVLIAALDLLAVHYGMRGGTGTGGLSSILWLTAMSITRYGFSYDRESCERASHQCCPPCSPAADR